MYQGIDRTFNNPEGENITNSSVGELCALFHFQFHKKKKLSLHNKTQNTPLH